MAEEDPSPSSQSSVGPLQQFLFPPASLPRTNNDSSLNRDFIALALQDGTVYQGFSFGAKKSIAGECVFQTGMVGYTESLTDPSYSGQILVLTFPLIGNYGVPSRKNIQDQLDKLPLYFESSKIHIAGLVVGQLSEDYSHYLADSSLDTWLKENHVPGIFGIDTRALTKKIRSQGVMLGKILMPKSHVDMDSVSSIKSAENFLSLFENIKFSDPNDTNLVSAVSTKISRFYVATPGKEIKLKHGNTITVMAVDVGMKYNQIRCFVSRGVNLKVVPWDYDFVKDQDYDGLFISNGPGDPTVVQIVIERLKIIIQEQQKPVFGICLGHQLLALSIGAKTKKMKYGNRGHNIPCTDLQSGRCHITSQNHGYAVDAESLPSDWCEYFVNANDGSNEGIMHKTLPYFSVQFHPESTPGPRDTEYLFDKFISLIRSCDAAGKLVSITQPVSICNPVRVDVHKVLILGSGGLSIGQAGEFDYSGSQAIKALKEEGIYTVLINPNIATIQTSKGLADKVYFLPVTPDFVRKVIKHERPDGIYVSFGGQTALNCGVQMMDEFQSLGVKVLGTPLETVIMTEDREIFAKKMAEIHEKCAESASATNLTEALAAANTIGYPLIVRAAYALGGLGSGFANNEEELSNLCKKAFAISPQVLIERSMKGWKEIEYEVVRDINDNCITVCNMENFDPLGIHTGDSIVVAPSQTLSDEDYNMLRTTAVNVIRHLGVIGECNIQYALNPDSKEYCIIEVNARLSRSSALASKATGYPLAFVAAKLGLGIPLSELKNNVTKVTCACFEPSLDYVVVKIPRWDLKKFNRVSTKVGSAMKSVGEVMAIGRNFEETIQKAIRSIDFTFQGFSKNSLVQEIDDELRNPSDLRLFAIATALHMNYSVDKIWEMTKIDRWFLNKLQNIVQFEKMASSFNAHTLPSVVMRQAKQLGFSDSQLAKLYGTSEIAMRKIRQDAGVFPFVKQIDTVAAEFPSFTNYLYMTYNAVENDLVFGDRGVMVIGSGVYRIGSSVEFDWCAVRTVRTLRENGFKTVMVNYNPETVSTDYDEADRLYFENINLETVLDIYEIESSSGVCVSMGGQTPNNIALALHRQNVRILGTSPEQIDCAENRYKFSRMCDSIGVDQPRWKELTSYEEAATFCSSVGFPVLVRPSYVLSGAAMNVVYSSEDLENYLKQAVAVSQEHPVVISKFIEEAKEIEMDAIAKDGKLIYHVICEHVENAGVHSGDATLILPPQDLENETIKKIVDATKKIGNALNVTGPFNIQFIAKNNEIKVIECNVRASRSFPFCSKVVGIDMIELATKAMMGLPFETYPESKIPSSNYVSIKVPQFSFSRLSGADPVLGVEMASTGEVACFGKDKYEAYMKALVATGFKVPKKNILISIGSFKEKQEMLPSVWKLHRHGYIIFATSGTADFMSEHGIPVKVLDSFDGETGAQQKSEYSLTQHLSSNMIDLYINLPSRNRYRRPANYLSRGYRTRRMAVDLSVPLITNVKCAKLFIEAVCRDFNLPLSNVDYQTSHEVISLPGLYNVSAFAPTFDSELFDINSLSQACARGGFTFFNIAPFGYKELLDSKSFVDNFDQCEAMTDFSITLAPGYRVEAETEGFPIAFKLGSGNGCISIENLTESFSALAQRSPIFFEGTGSELAAVLYIASMKKIPLHVSNVKYALDLDIISMAKKNGQHVTCDVPIYNMFLSTKEYPNSKVLGSFSDVEYLWNHRQSIDCFSVGSTPFLLAAENLDSTQLSQASYIGIEESLPLLLNEVSNGRMTFEELEKKLVTNPKKIFGLFEPCHSEVEIEIDRMFHIASDGLNLAKCGWTPFAGRKLKGAVSRVIFQKNVVYVDGSIPDNLQKKGKLLLSESTSADENLKPVSLNIDQSPRRVRKTSAISRESVFFPASASAKTETFIPADDRIEKALQKVELIERTIQKRDHDLSLDRSSIPPDLLRSAKTVYFKQHIISVKQFTRPELHILFNAAHEMRTIVERHGSCNLLQGKISCNLFYEPSTRTAASFEAAMIRLGGQVINISQTTSSVQKGESLQDTVKTLGSYADAIVLRHPQIGSVSTAAKNSTVPVINAGDGIGEHPTQAFLDVYTIREELGTVNGLTITVVGDLKNGRTVHSLVKILSLYDVKINYISPKSLRIPESVKSELDVRGVIQSEFEDLSDAVLSRTDVLYVTRIQKERFSDLSEYETIKNSFQITTSTLAVAKPSMVVMHPLPRLNEIDPEVDFDPRAAYFRQMRYGLYVRMALLALVLS